MSAPQVSEKLLQAARVGDSRALANLLRDLWPWIRNKARRYVSSHDATAPMGVSSLTQETSLRFSRTIGSVRAVSSERVLALLDTIMRNTAKDARRNAHAQKRDPGVLIRLDATGPEVDPKTDDQPPQLGHLSHADLDKEMQAALAKVPDRQRQAFLLHMEGVLPAEIATQMDCSTPEAASMLVQRARKELRQALAKFNPLASDESASGK